MPTGQESHMPVLVVVQAAVRYCPASQDVVQVLQADCAPKFWYWPAPQTAQAVCPPTEGVKVPERQVGHDGVAVVVQELFRYWPAEHCAVHVRHCVDALAMGWYVPAAHATHVRSAVAMHCAWVTEPAGHCAVHDVHDDAPDSGWNVPAAQGEHDVMVLAPALNEPGAH